MTYGILLLRVVLGLIMAAHGAQKLFGWWNGPGLQGIHGWLTSMRFRGGWAPVALLVAGEFGGGLLLAAGLFVPFAAFAIIAVMLVAIATTHWRNGFWNGAGGYEFNLLILLGAAALAATGGGRGARLPAGAAGWTRARGGGRTQRHGLRQRARAARDVRVVRGPALGVAGRPAAHARRRRRHVGRRGAAASADRAG